MKRFCSTIHRKRHTLDEESTHASQNSSHPDYINLESTSSSSRDVVSRLCSFYCSWPHQATRLKEESSESAETSDEAGGVDGVGSAGVGRCGWGDHASSRGVSSTSTRWLIGLLRSGRVFEQSQQGAKERERSNGSRKA